MAAETTATLLWKAFATPRFGYGRPRAPNWRGVDSQSADRSDHHPRFGKMYYTSGLPDRRGQAYVRLALQAGRMIFVSINECRWLYKLGGTLPPTSSTPASMFFSSAWPVRLALVKNALASSATATFA